ncbi:hypothetical protein PCO85_05545 [Prodigiosinella aquatilis]|nr:hypothetical protein [Prodigiosinella sp. LS101]WJV54892.1 hypothetical protein PCO85_05545 [Prodigiosinella sp. LS101]
MSNVSINIRDLNSIFNLLRRLGHLRLWIFAVDCQAYGEGMYYGVTDQNERVLAEWDEQLNCWQLREEAWQVVVDPQADYPREILAELVDASQIFNLSLICLFC